MIRYTVHPKQLADGMKSILQYVKSTKHVYDVMIQGTADGLMLVGVNQYTAGIQFVPGEVQGQVDPDALEVLLVHTEAPSRSEPEGEQGVAVVDDLNKLAAATTPGSKTGISAGVHSRIQVTIEDGKSFLIEDGPNLVGELGDTGGSSSLHDWVIDRLAVDGGEKYTRIAMTQDTISRLTKVKSDASVLDFLPHPTEDGIAIVKCGTLFKGLITTVDREIFANGGRYGTGEGSPDKLLN